jgi:enediyne biosynthesis protein E4
VLPVLVLAIFLPLASNPRVFAQGGMAIPNRESQPPKPSPRLKRIPKIHLNDVASQAGLTFRHVSGEPFNKKYLLEATGAGVAIFDYDNDGLPDIFFVNGGEWTSKNGAKPTNRLYRNLGNLQFRDVTSEAGLTRHGWGQGACVGDYDNDGYSDLFVTYYGSNVLYHNDGKGHFVDVTAEVGLPTRGTRWNTGCSFFDFDRDGRLDIAVANYIDFDPKSTPLPGEKFCVFKGLPVACGPRGLPSGRNLLYRNVGGRFVDISRESHFDEPSGRYCFTAITGDFDDDGWPDVYFACDSTPSILLRNNHDGTFTDVGIPVGVALNESGQLQGSMGADAADFDHTGRLSLVVTTFDDDIPALFRHDADGFFTDVSLRAGLGYRTDQVGWGTAFVDLDNDGWQEIFMVNGHVYPNIDQLKNGSSRYRQAKYLYYNLHDGNFVDVSDLCGPGLAIKTSARGLAYGDLDNDGSLELVVNNLDSGPNLFRNSEKGGNWISFRLVGTSSNRDAIGARVRVKAGNLLQMAEVRSGCCYMSQSEMRLHFGIGMATAIDWVDVRWPDGKAERFAVPRVNTVQEIKQGTSRP